jgi:hypothetical protein
VEHDTALHRAPTSGGEGFGTGVQPPALRISTRADPERPLRLPTPTQVPPAQETLARFVTTGPGIVQGNVWTSQLGVPAAASAGIEATSSVAKMAEATEPRTFAHMSTPVITDSYNILSPP